MSSDHARWADALKIERTHGMAAMEWIAERINALALDDDAEGVQRILDIAGRSDSLRGGTRQ